ncbi:MAG: cobalamin biosynthesis protein CobW, partial [Magnetovibrio sp.]|nr:cobalamin biosynthesis protein CobW [Magnetovibrio sp.]
LPAIEALLERDEPPQHIVIETSGLALPKPLVKAFNWPEVRSSVTVDGVIAVIDAPAVAAGRFADDPETVQAEREADPALDHDSLLADIFEDQLRCADIVLLNKTDLVDGKDLDTVRSRLAKAIDPLIKVLPTIHGRTDTRVLLGLAAAVEDQIEARPSHHGGNGGDSDHDHDGFNSFVVALGPVGDPAALEERIRATVADHGILRVKGFVDVPGKEMRHVVQGVGPRLQRYYDRPWRPGEERRSELVVIGMAGLDQMAIQAALMG